MISGVGMGMACGEWQECKMVGHEWMLGDICSNCRPELSAVAPWSDRAGALRYLRSASNGEMAALARTAALMLEGGDWWGIHSRNGWVSQLRDVEDSLWHHAATNFIATYDRELPCLNESFVWFAADDLATELLYHRGWCPHKPWDKHAADEPDNPVALSGEPELLLLECHCLFQLGGVYVRPAIPASPEAPEVTARDHPEYGPARDASLLCSLVDGNQVPFVGHSVFIRWTDDG